MLPEKAVDLFGNLHQVFIAIPFHIEIINKTVFKITHCLFKAEHLFRGRLAALPDKMLLQLGKVHPRGVAGNAQQTIGRAVVEQEEVIVAADLYIEFHCRIISLPGPQQGGGAVLRRRINRAAVGKDQGEVRSIRWRGRSGFDP